MTHGFEGVARSLRAEISAFYEREGQPLQGESGMSTLETNSGYVERRGAPLVSMVLARLKVASLDGLRLLDLGCGFGSLSAYFATLGADVVAVDSNESRLEVGRAVTVRHSLPVEFVGGRMQKLQLPERSFDVAVQNNSLCYVVPAEERLFALSEALRVLRPGGVFVSRNPNRWHPLDQFTGLPLVQLLTPAHAVRVAAGLGRKRSLTRVTSPPKARRELNAAGFGEVMHHGIPKPFRPDALKVCARYQHFTARRPRNAS